MGASAKRKKEKKKDFQKAKLKVGKTKPKASNFTDTSFRSKGIVLRPQSISTNAPTQSGRFSHHLSLLSSQSASQRRDSLAHITSVVASTPELPVSAPVLLAKVLPLIYDESQPVRRQLEKLCHHLPDTAIQQNAERFVMHIRLGLNWINPDVRMDTLNILSYVLQAARAEVVSCSGGWTKILKCFIALFGWHTEGQSSGKWATKGSGLGVSNVQEKTAARQLQVFGQFLEAGIGAPKDIQDDGHSRNPFPYWDTIHHALPQRSDCFKRLTLFGPSRDEESQMLEEREERQALIQRHYRSGIEKGLADAKRHGGETGRAAAQVQAIFENAMDTVRDE